MYYNWLISAHDEGEVKLQVACDGFIVSQSVIFKYKANPNKKETETQSSQVIITQNQTSLQQQILLPNQSMDFITSGAAASACGKTGGGGGTSFENIDPLVALGKDDLKYRLLNKLEQLGICSLEDMQQMYKVSYIYSFIWQILYVLILYEF